MNRKMIRNPLKKTTLSNCCTYDILPFYYIISFNFQDEQDNEGPKDQFTFSQPHPATNGNSDHINF